MSRKRTENGVEVVVNHVEPYRLAGRAGRLSLEKEYTIDFGREEIGALGLANAIDFEVDGSRTDHIFSTATPRRTRSSLSMNRDGSGARSDGKGKGPGEVNWILFAQFDAAGRLVITDHMNHKVLTFDDSGRCLGETRFPSGDRILYPLANGNFICLRRNRTEKSPMPEDVFSLLDGAFNEIGILDRQNAL